MLKGLQAMQAAELTEIARLTGLKEGNPGQLRAGILTWIEQTVGCPPGAPAAIERAALEWIAGAWKIAFEADEPTDSLEQKIRVSIARDVAEHLRPAWALTCALAAAGPPEGLPSKLRLLDVTASLVVPSGSARRRLFEEWNNHCLQLVESQDMLAYLRPALEVLKARPEGATQALSLALVVSLADGRISLKAEKLFHQAALELGLRPEQASQLLQKLTGAFWIHHHDAQAKGDDQFAAGRSAAEQTLGSAGMLEALVLEAREGLAGALESQNTQRPAAWRRALGSLPGLSSFLSSKLPGKGQATLARLVYLMILRQHSLYSQEARQHAEEAREAALQATAPAPEPAPQPVPQTASQPVTQTVTQTVPEIELAPPEPDTVPVVSTRPVRSVKL